MPAHESKNGSGLTRPVMVAFLVAMGVLGAVAPLTRPFSPEGQGAPAQVEEVPAPAFGS